MRVGSVLGPAECWKLTHIYAYIYIYTHVHVHICIDIDACIGMYVSMFIYVCV